MREPGPVDGRNLSPDRIEQRIVDLVGRQGVEQLAVDAFERQRDGAVAEPSQCLHLRTAHARTAGEHQQQGLVLHIVGE